MTPKLSTDLAKALDEHDGKLTLQHPVTGQPVVLIIGQKLEEEMRKVLYDDSQVSADEMLAAAEAGNSGPEGWDAPGMEVYDKPDYAPPTDRP
jgi:hypothetical protein